MGFIFPREHNSVKAYYLLQWLIRFFVCGTMSADVCVSGMRLEERRAMRVGRRGLGRYFACNMCCAHVLETDMRVRPLESFALLTGIFLRVFTPPCCTSSSFTDVYCSCFGLLVDGISGARAHAPSRRRGGGNKKN